MVPRLAEVRPRGLPERPGGSPGRQGPPRHGEPTGEIRHSGLAQIGADCGEVVQGCVRVLYDLLGNYVQVGERALRSVGLTQPRFQIIPTRRVRVSGKTCLTRRVRVLPCIDRRIARDPCPLARFATRRGSVGFSRIDHTTDNRPAPGRLMRSSTVAHCRRRTRRSAAGPTHR